MPVRALETFSTFSTSSALLWNYAAPRQPPLTALFTVIYSKTPRQNRGETPRTPGHLERRPVLSQVIQTDRKAQKRRNSPQLDDRLQMLRKMA
ncbi:hypothetical protein GN956_G7190 [Arapaima gigas]